MPPLQPTQPGKHCISRSIFAFNTLHHSHGSERHKNTGKSEQPGFSRHNLLPSLPLCTNSSAALNCTQGTGPCPAVQASSAPTLQGGVEARGQCWRGNKWAATGHGCILAASREKALNPQSSEVRGAVMVSLQPLYRAGALYFISLFCW